MSNRFTQLSTSSFKPLSLEEIMAVPLAKQAQHDEAMLSLDEFSKMEANSLDQDKDYVSGQIEAFRGESEQISNDLLDNGVNRSLVNKIKGLRDRKNQEFSLQGKTGQASAAFNQYQANKESIMKRRDLTAEQKEAGLLKAKSDYAGVQQGGQYQDYVGTAFVDIMEKGRQIASQMKPEEKAGALGMTYDPSTGFYSDGTYQYETLTPEHISKVVYQGLKNDQIVGDYANEIQELGIATDADQMLREAATNAGNVYQVANKKTTNNPLSSSLQKKANSDEGRIDTGQPWNSISLVNMQDAFSRSYDVIPEEEASDLFNTETGELIQYSQKDIDASENLKKRLKDIEDAAKAAPLGYSQRTVDLQKDRARMEFESAKRVPAAAKKLGDAIKRIKQDNPSTANLKDIEVYKLYNDAKKRATVYASQVVKPSNPKNTYKTLMKELVGEGNRDGYVAQKTIRTKDGSEVSFDQLIENDEFDSFDREELYQSFRDTANGLGFAPGIIGMPGATAIQFRDPDGFNHTIYAEPDEKERRAFNAVGKMNDAVVSGVNYHHEQLPDGRHEQVMTELSPRTRRYEAAVVRSSEKIPNDDLRELEWEPANNPKYPGALISEYNGKPVLRYNMDDETQRVSNKVTQFYDESPNASQVLSKEQKN